MKKMLKFGAIAFLVLIVIGAIASQGDDSNTTAATTTSTTTGGSASTPAPNNTTNATSSAPAAKSDGKASDGGWVLESTKFEASLGDFGGTARITNTEDSTRSGSFTLTLFKGDEQVGTVTGFASDVESGKTVTVQLISTDDYVSGPYRVEFQNDF